MLVSAVLPVRSARAFLPAVALAAYITPAASSTALYLTAGFAGALGLVGAYLTIKDAQDNAVRIPLTTDPAKSPPVPLAASTVPAGQSQLVWSYQGCPWGGSGTGSTLQEACAAAGGDSVNGQYNCIKSGYGACYYGQTTQSTCPPGYASQSGNCVLVNARQVTDDKTCDLLLANGQFATADDMNCPSTVSTDKLSPMIRDGKVVAYGTNSNGQPLVFTVSPGASATTLSVQEQIQTATQTQVQTTTATLNPATGEVVAVQTSVAPGSISSPSAASSPTTATADSTNTPQVSTSPNTQLAPNIQFPTDYARQGEAQAAANPIKTSVDKLGDVSNASLNDPVNPDSAEFENGFFKNTFNGLSAWTVPGHVSECPKPDLSYTVFGHYTHIILDAHCTLYESVKPLVAVAFNVVWVVVALFIVLGA